MTRAGGARVVLLSGNSLCHNPRALKEATALAHAGYDVQVLGAWLEPELKARDLELVETAPFRFVPVLNRTLPGFRAAASDSLRRARRKAASVVHRITGHESPYQLGSAIESMTVCARAIAADLFIAHSEPGLHVAVTLMRDGRRVGVDMEDWFSEDLLPQARRDRPLRLLRSLEHELLTRGAYASCPSRAMSAALKAQYGGKSPTIIYNAFPWADRQAIDGLRKDRRSSAIPSVCWYSQTLGPGRGLEDLAAAIPLLQTDAEFHLRGRIAPDMEKWIRSRIPERRQQHVFFEPLVSNDELLSRVAEHDIGFAGEITDCRSRDLTVTNKVLHYLLAGLALVASDTAGQREIAAQAPGAVELYPSGNAHALATALDRLLGSLDRLAAAKAASLRAAERTFCWERQEGALLEAIAVASLT